MATAKVFELRLRAEPGDIDENGHVNNVVYLRYAQEAAVAHWLAVTSVEQQAASAWVVRRHEIDYLRPAFEGEELIARTNIGEASGATLERFVEILRAADGETLARCRTVWVQIDPQTLRPRRISPDLRTPFFENA